jgi:hypothetical protein
MSTTAAPKAGVSRKGRAEALLSRLCAGNYTNHAIEALKVLVGEMEECASSAKGRGRRARTPSAAKAKGRAGVVEARELVLKWLDALEPDDILIQTTSVGGSDLHFSPKAARAFPYAPEVKNVENLNVWQALKQAEINSRKKGGTPILFFRRNNSTMHVAVTADEFLRLLRVSQR